MSIGWATIVPGTEMPAGDGTTGAVRCILASPGRSNFAAIVKRDALQQVVAEAFCALLLRGWGAPVPDPYLITEANNNVAFGSADATYPNLNQRLGIAGFAIGSAEHQAAIGIATRLASQLPSAPLVAAADEAIDNRDRNLGNILWDGTSEAWIDHAFALGNGAQHLADVNKLCQMAIYSGLSEEMRSASTAQWLLMDRDKPGDAKKELNAFIDTSNQVSFVTDRLNQLGMRLLARFPTPQDLLSGQ